MEPESNRDMEQQRDEVKDMVKNKNRVERVWVKVTDKVRIRIKVRVTDKDRDTDKDMESQRVRVKVRVMEPERDKVREKERDMEPERDKDQKKIDLLSVLTVTLEGEGSNEKHVNLRKSEEQSQPLISRLRGQNRDERYFSICVPLYEASLTGNWDVAYAILGPNREYVTYAIDMDYNTPLHIAAYAQETEQTRDFVEKLLNLMTPEELKLKNHLSSNALCVAAAYGNIGMVKSMVRKNAELVNIIGAYGYPPLYKSAQQGRYETIRYLYELSPNLDNIEYWRNDEKKIRLLTQCVEYGFFDVALQIVRNHPRLAKEGSVLGVLARKPDAFKRDCIHNSDNDDDAWRLLKIIWRDIIMREKTERVKEILAGPKGRQIIHPDPAKLEYKYPFRILFVATEMGNTLFVIELLRAYPGLTWITNDDNRTIFHVAAMHRRLALVQICFFATVLKFMLVTFRSRTVTKSIFNILYEMGKRKNTISIERDGYGNTMLHLIGMTSKKMRDETFGASLLLQRELLWFKEVEEMMLPSYREIKNRKGETAYQIFLEQNKDVISQAVNWMRDCMVVTTLIVTVTFAVAFTIPGGYYQETKGHDQKAGIPIFVRKPSFLVFVIADAISFSSASTSLVMFLSLLITRHSQRDFIHAFPRKLMIGLITLFISVAAMMVTFSASFFVLDHQELKWVPITIAVLVSIPALTFSVFQFHLLLDMIASMFYSRYLFNPKRHKLYKRD
ncbi:hypothetical protein OSB04_017556 [Centaurea solstitialis]|uniref:PGG domain-containing protein n=1 Tax=Centaurea solstitialis TaxID=347529 RepID=A0AA38TE30_9ASTR|nr:hypothetical protein OSB04_017556 [Centaurea solstitialis]